MLCAAAQAAPLAREDVPEPLKPWVPWVLHGAGEQLCPPSYQDAGTRLCNWPARLALRLNGAGGEFSLGARLSAPGWLPLPGDDATWPMDVTANGREAAVLPLNGQPALYLAPGAYQIGGRFVWNSAPKSLRVPPETGLVELSFDGSSRAHPARDARGYIWLSQPDRGAPAQANHLGLRVFRLIDDGIPLQVQTRIQLEVAGAVREELLGPVLLPGFIPMKIDGALPARLEEDGRLRVQLRPGVWNIDLTARAPGEVGKLTLPSAAEPWPAEEVWSFRAHNHLRVVEVGGAPGIDPRQAQTPEEWRDLPAYQLQRGATLAFAEKQRGNPEPEPDRLSLRRQLWLDFDGRGFSIQDQLGGALSRSWRLSAQAPIALGRVMVDGEPQLITRHGDSTGVEVRRGQLNLSADSRVDGAIRRLPASGWNSDLQNVETTLHLPPGWRLFAAPGADNVPDTWLSRWTLLDLFIVLIASVAALRLFGPAVAALSLLAFALTWHEPGAPRWAWLNLIAAIALLRALPASFEQSKLRRWLERYRWVSALALLLIAIPFAVQQARMALHPQLELDYFAFAFPEKQAELETRAEADLAQAPPPMAAPVESYELAEEAAGRVRKFVGGAAGISMRDSKAARQSAQRLDPNVLMQTGPGVPQWSWRAAQLSWAGPVTAEQTFRLWLLPPWLTRALTALSLVLIALLFARWLELRPGHGREWLQGLRRTLAPAGVLVGLLLGAGHAPELQAQDASSMPVPPEPPTPSILEELRARLLAPPDCMPACAALPRLALGIAGERLTLRLTAEAQVESAIPLPLPLQTGAEQQAVWQPDSVLLDGSAADLRRIAGGALWLRLPAGRHELVVSGDLSGLTGLQLPLSLRPHRVSADTPGWLLTGVDERGQAGEALQLLRQQLAGAAEAAPAASNQQALPPLLIVRRTLRLGLDWDVETTVERVGVTHTAVLASIPLLAGEAVIGEHIRVVDGQVQLSLAPGQMQAGWSSRLPVTQSLKLAAPQARDAVEVWRFDISPIWHVDFSGIAPVLHQEGEWRLPTYQPWPGEHIELAVSRPGALQGQVLTLDQASLQIQPGKRATDLDLNLRLRASQGGQHAIELPEGLGVQHFFVDGQAQPPRVEGQRLVLPLRPGEQNLRVQLRADEGIGWITRTPALDLKLPGVNAEILVRMPPDRWTLLLGGPRLGPAVLFWSLFAVLLVIAWALGRVPLTPLKARHWMLLMIGLSQIPVWAAAIVAGWLLALGLRGRAPESIAPRRFNAMQVLLALLTLLALGLLFSAVANGLLGTPNMQVAGNGSSAYELKWFQDRYENQLPRVWVLSVSIWVYRVLMLLWALWLANALLGWLRWGWEQYSRHGIWKKKPVVAPAPSTPATDSG